MNTHGQPGGGTPAARNGSTEGDSRLLVHLVDFKWLMAGLGWWVDLNRLQHDAVYATECYSRAATSSCAPLRRAAATLMQLLPLKRH
jgi:hypothetical protein